MDTKDTMILIKGKIKTSEILSYMYREDMKKVDVQFKNGKVYPYSASNVECLKNPAVLDPASYRISKENQDFFNIAGILEFQSKVNGEVYWHISFKNGTEKDYRRGDLNIMENCLKEKRSSDIFEYIKHIADLVIIRNDDTGEETSLTKRFEKISCIGRDVALAKYLNPDSLHPDCENDTYIPIFPFGCNNSQYKAVKNAMEKQISVIQGPPGTGKTQTILNIIANILMQGKTVLIVSNNNSATGNVHEKLSSPKYNLGFIAATLGKAANKQKFIKSGQTDYPNFTSWKTEEDPLMLKRMIEEKSAQLKIVFDRQEKLAGLRQELSQLCAEHEYFKQYAEASGISDAVKTKKNEIQKSGCIYGRNIR